MPFPVRFYTAGPDNRILGEKVATTPIRGAAMIAKREQERFAAEPAAASIDTIDAAYAGNAVRHPDAVYRDVAIRAHHEGRPSFILKHANTVGETAISVVERGGDLAAHIERLASALIGNGHQTYPELLAWHADRALRDLVPTNGAARRLLEDAQWRLSRATSVTRLRRGRPADAQREAA